METTNELIYRVIARTTGSVQPGRGSTTWTNEVIYCGDDRQAARIAYHASAPQDFCGGYGNRARETIMQQISDDDAVDEMRSENGRL